MQQTCSRFSDCNNTSRIHRVWYFHYLVKYFLLGTSSIAKANYYMVCFQTSRMMLKYFLPERNILRAFLYYVSATGCSTAVTSFLRPLDNCVKAPAAPNEITGLQKYWWNITLYLLVLDKVKPWSGLLFPAKQYRISSICSPRLSIILLLSVSK